MRSSRTTPETLNNLANTFKRLGLAAEAEKRWNAALAINPDYAEVYSNLANLLLDQGEYERAETMARRAIELSPRLADAYINLAAVATACHRHGEALRTLDALLAFAPSHPRALAARALALKELDRLDEALDAANRAALQAPASPEPHNAVGQVLQAMGRFEPALAAYDRAAALPGPAQQDAVANRGLLFMEFGRKAEALTALEDAAKAFPNSAGILLSQTDLKRFAPDDPLIARMQALLAREGISVADRTTLHFGLGKAFLDTGNSEEAFRHYDEANRLKRSTFAYDPDANERWMASIAEAFSSALLEAKAEQGARSNLPIFVVGMPRSGTTLVEQILASHPMVHGAGELRRLRTLVDGLGDFPACAPDLSAAQMKALGEAYLADVAPMSAGRRHVVDKMPSNFSLCGLIRLVLPDARIIHSRRDPMDTCLSCYTKLFAGEQAFAYDQGKLGRFHLAHQALMAHWRAILPASHFLEVDYEAVVEDIEAQTRRMLDFLGLPWNEACLRFHETARPVRTASVEPGPPAGLSGLGRSLAQARGATRSIARGPGPWPSSRSSDTMRPGRCTPGVPKILLQEDSRAPRPPRLAPQLMKRRTRSRTCRCPMCGSVFRPPLGVRRRRLLAGAVGRLSKTVGGAFAKEAAVRAVPDCRLFKDVSLAIAKQPFFRSIRLAAAIAAAPLAGCSGVLDPAGPVGAAQRLILIDSLAIMLAIVLPVIVAIAGFAFWFRASNPRAFYWPEWEFSGHLELIVWAIPALVVVVLGGVAWFGSHELDPFRPLPGNAKPVEVQVVSLDWKWLFIYPDEGVASVNALAVPVGVPIHFTITSSGVMNSFFVPRLGSQIYAMAGMATQLWLQADQAGTFDGFSANFSGEGFADMRFDLKALPEDDYAKWIAEAKASGADLDRDRYAELVKPSMNVSPSAYRSVEPRLFESIVNGTAPQPSASIQPALQAKGQATATCGGT